jgi:hypothetical protein
MVHIYNCRVYTVCVGLQGLYIRLQYINVGVATAYRITELIYKITGHTYETAGYIINTTEHIYRITGHIYKTIGII